MAAVNDNCVDLTFQIVDGSWEKIDPNVNIRDLFYRYNEVFFDGALVDVRLGWSPYLKSKPGLCKYDGASNGERKCEICLSSCLLKSRPLRDTIQTLLHEMIHALLFQTQNNRNHDYHCSDFVKHMHRINEASGINITIQHGFSEEPVNTDDDRHVWRCDGPCRDVHPFYGYVKRLMNRAPSSNASWWSKHQQNCGGTFIKIKEPKWYGLRQTKASRRGIAFAVANENEEIEVLGEQDQQSDNGFQNDKSSEENEHSICKDVRTRINKNISSRKHVKPSPKRKGDCTMSATDAASSDTRNNASQRQLSPTQRNGVNGNGSAFKRKKSCPTARQRDEKLVQSSGNTEHLYIADDGTGKVSSPRRQLKRRSQHIGNAVQRKKLNVADENNTTLNRSEDSRHCNDQSSAAYRSMMRFFNFVLTADLQTTE